MCTASMARPATSAISMSATDSVPAASPRVWRVRARAWSGHGARQRQRSDSDLSTVSGAASQPTQPVAASRMAISAGGQICPAPPRPPHAPQGRAGVCVPSAGSQERRNGDDLCRFSKLQSPTDDPTLNTATVVCRTMIRFGLQSCWCCGLGRLSRRVAAPTRSADAVACCTLKRRRVSDSATRSCIPDHMTACGCA